MLAASRVSGAVSGLTPGTGKGGQEVAGGVVSGGAGRFQAASRDPIW
jgi:hypothetical protein